MPGCDRGLAVSADKTRANVRCQICGLTVPGGALQDHVKSVHPEQVRAQLKRDKDAEKLFLKVMVPGFAAWLVAFALLVVIPTPLPLTLLVPGMMIGFLILVLGTYGYAQRLTRSDVENLQRLCRICDRPMPQALIGPHLKREHPEEARHLRLSRAYLVFSAAPVIVAEAILGQVLFPWVSGGHGVAVSLILTYSGLFLWIGLVMVWMAGIEPRYLARARANWRALQTLDIHEATPRANNELDRTRLP